jgi:hypothetical protein
MGNPGPETTLATTTTAVIVTGISTTVAVTGESDTGIGSDKAMWLTGYNISSSSGLIAIQGVYMEVSGATWVAKVVVLGLDASASSATLRVFYTYTE